MRALSKLSRFGAALALLAGSARAQDVAITGGRVFTVSGATIDNATVLIQNGRITAVGTNVAIPAGVQRIDAAGKWVTPGLVVGGTEIGLQEIGAIGSTNDQSATGKDQIAASFQPWLGLNTASVLIAPGRKEGVTTVGIAPQGGLVAGQLGVIDLVPGHTSDMLRKPAAAMVAQLSSPRGGGAASRGELIARLKELLDDTKSYARRRADYERAQARPFIARQSDLEAMIPVVEGRMPLIIDADNADDIEAALSIAKEYKLRLAISGGAEAWKVADRLAAAGVPVFTGAMNNIPASFAQLGQRQENAGLLRKAGVSVSLIGNAGGGDEEAFNIRNIKQEAGNAIAYGMTWNDALRAVTLAPATFLGVSDRIGSIENGKDGNVVMWSGDPFEFSTRAEHVFIKGREYSEKTRQDMLAERYRTLPPSYYKP
ncbi:MAG: amidohydrolase [Gemmatimonadetes bacterium]|nr:amidohydrolase [Gemmatimonadota bacterium]